MKHRYLPMTEQDRNEMLETIGVASLDDLFAEIPSDIKYEGILDIPEKYSEASLTKHMTELAAKNNSSVSNISFLGAGVYEHFIPSVVGHVISRSEFYTAYTPYQPEISQGELQGIFEFQTMICEMTGMDVANSSLYDGFTAITEAASMAASITRRSKVVVSKAVHPEARQILTTSAKGLHLDIVEVEFEAGITSLSALQSVVDEDVAAVIIQSPNFFGCIEDLASIEALVHQHKGLFVVSCNPMSLGLLKPPGHLGADIVIGDAQPFGIPTSYGGPHCGFITTKKGHMRRIPGRIVGQTVDENGVRGFVLTLQAREQHIRRDKAASNICSNQALNALAAAVYMSTMGKQGIQDVARQNYHKAHYACHQLSQLKGIETFFSSTFFNEFVLRFNKDIHGINEKLLSRGIIGGYELERTYPDLKNCMLLAVTELRSKQEIDTLVTSLEELL